MSDQPRILVVDDRRAVHEHVRTLLWAQAVEASIAEEEASGDGSGSLDSLEDTGAFLLTKGFEIESAYQGLQGVASVRAGLDAGLPYSLAIVDLMMPPGIDGVETAQRIWRVDPDVQIVLCAQHFNHSWSAIAKQLERADSFLILRKPFEKHEILQVVYALTEKWKLKREVELANERRYRTLYHDAPAMFLTYDRSGTILTANDFGARQLGYSADEMVGLSWGKLHPRQARASYRDHLRDCLRDPSRVASWQGPKRRRDGALIWVRETSRAVADAEGKPTVFSVCEDITRARRLEQMLMHQSKHDQLTGLVNRKEFKQCLGELLAAEGGPHALCLIDLDQLRVVNEACGHESGDQLIREVTRMLREHLADGQVAARLGGDEFAVLIAGCDGEAARDFCDRFRAILNAYRFVAEGRTFNVGASIGVVPFARNEASVAALLEAAEAARDAAKAGGRDQVRIFELDSDELAARRSAIQWTGRIQRALESERLVLYQQPIVPLDPASGHGLHYEVLVRLIDDGGRIIAPGEFMPSVERYGLSRRLDEHVVRSALAFLRDNPRHTERLAVCSLNLSGHSVANEEFLGLLLDLLVGVPAHKLCFEVTETAAVADLSAASEFIREVKRLGCAFALDDFGAGMSSFGYLRHLPVDYLKIDGSLVKHIAEDEETYAMVRSIAEMAQTLRKATVAEFVENDEIAERLRRIGVDLAQGYGVGRPVPLSELGDEADALARAG